MTDAPESYDKPIKILIALAAAVVSVIAAYGAFVIYVSWPIALGNVDKAGVFGDSFGLLTSLFSGLAFAGIIYTILLQRDELGLQRKELRETREVMKEQSFESTFFQMLRLHNDIVNSTDIRKNGQVTVSGRDCFATFFQRLQKEYFNYKSKFDESELDYINYAYDLFWKGNQNDLGHYFRYLYNIFKFIKESDVEDKKLYSNLVRAQLSDAEILLLFYNCLYKYGVEKFKPIAEEFALFDNLPVGRLLNQNHAKLYDQSAFGNS